MRCVVATSNVKVLGKAVHSLSRIGDELYFEPLSSGLALRCVNSSRSAYGCFLFTPLFFQHYDSGAPPGGLEDSSFRCKMGMKSVQTVFKSLSSLDKTVEKCEIDLNPGGNRLVFQLHCKYGITKTHNLSFQESESLQPVFQKDGYANVLRAQPRLPAVLVFTALCLPLQAAGGHGGAFPPLAGRSERDDASKMMLTEMSLDADEFESFQVREETGITFCLKELRGLLSFAESSGLPLSMYFDQPGRPVVFGLDDPVLEVNFVLATLSDEETTTHRERNRSRPPQADTSHDDFLSDDMDSYMIAMETSAVGGAEAQPCSTGSDQRRERESDTAAGSTRSDQRRAREPVSAACSSGSKQQRGLESESEEEEEEELPGTPPQKRFRSLFFGSVLSPYSQGANQTLRNQEVLAEASDSDPEEQEEETAKK
ncbi:cell cycle checkpoint control protein RAD9A-like isoform X2 [Acipenser ruthenus]|uniref:cell cycle checkpoint control protein RAD9A-like isoform X2 n=1 Tax=Acipenser ruthenus TaxID=7906 RepID=UPI002741BDD5|nr:cell cycle checkpoint control protein RAD9A-like isoform X2 [Acipenser ruthenus]